MTKTQENVYCGCKGIFDGKERKLKSLFIEDVEGRKEFQKLASPKVKVLNDSSGDYSINEKRIPLRQFPRECFQVLFSTATFVGGQNSNSCNSCPRGTI